MNITIRGVPKDPRCFHSTTYCENSRRFFVFGGLNDISFCNSDLGIFQIDFDFMTQDLKINQNQ